MFVDLKLTVLNKENWLKAGMVLVCSLIVGILVNYYYKEALVYVLGAIVFIGLVMAILTKRFWGILLVAFFLPFEQLGSFEIAGMTVRISQIFALITILAWIGVFLMTKRHFATRNPLIVPIFLFSGVSILSLVGAVNLQRSLVVLIFILFVMLMSIMIPNLVRTEERLRMLIGVILLSSLVVTVFGLYQFVGDMVGLPKEMTGLRSIYTSQVFGFPRVQGTSSEPLYFANFLLIPIGLCLALVLQRKKDEALNKKKLIDGGKWLYYYIAALLRNKLFIWLVLGLAVLNLILTLSRGGFLGLGVILILAGIVYFKSLFSLKRILIIGLIAIVAISSTVYLLKFTRKDQNIDIFLGQATEFEAGASIDERFSTYHMAWELIKRNPILGVGIGGFGPEVAKGSHVVPKDGWLIVNNEYLELWAETGILGLLCFVLLIGIIIARSIKVWLKCKDVFVKTVVIGSTIAFCGILAQYMTFSILFIIHIWFLIGLIVAAQNLALNYKTNS